ncbi:MAG: hypothetical protein Q9203_002544 [Teloschistes exilis]
MAQSQAPPPISRQNSPGAAADLKLTDEIMSSLSTTLADCKNGEQEKSQAKRIADKASSSDHEKPEAAPEVPFPFMKLPMEIRSMIYQDVLQQAEDIRVEGFLSRLSCDHAVATHCRIFLVSKAFYQEAMPIYFGCNTFDFVCTAVLHYVVRNLSVVYRRQFRSIKISWDRYDCSGAAKFLQGCVSLRRLNIQFQGSLFRWCLIPDQIKPWGVGELLKVRGIIDLELNISHWDHYPKHYKELVEKLQVLKQPYSVAALRRREKIDYPPKKAQRRVFGKANVVTRSERKMIANGQQYQEDED